MVDRPPARFVGQHVELQRRISRIDITWQGGPPVRTSEDALMQGLELRRPLDDRSHSAVPVMTKNLATSYISMCLLRRRPGGSVPVAMMCTPVPDKLASA